MKSKYLIAIIAILVLLNILLTYRIQTLKTYIKTNNSPAFSKLQGHYSELTSAPYFVLRDLNGNIYDIGELIKYPPYTLLVFFSLNDCAACLMEYELWNKISLKEMINVAAIAQHMDERELKIWIENARIKFPVLYDKDSEVKQRFGIKETPMKLLIDNEGKILLSDRFRISSEEKNEFVEIIKKITNFYN